MNKFLGMIFLMLGFWGLSLEKVKEKKREIATLSEIKSFATYLLKEIEYSHIPIPDICREYVERSEGIIRDFLEKVCNRYDINQGKSFDIIWKEVADETLMLKKEERKLLHLLGKSFGFCNLKMQMSAIEQYIQDIEKNVLQKEIKFQDNRKLILYFGVMSGLLLSIILL